MADRLTIITTRTGDDGYTSLADGSRVCKTDSRVIALGEVDELNSHLGLLLAELGDDQQNLGIAPIIRALKPTQHALFDIGSELAIPGHSQLRPEQLTTLDTLIESFNRQLPSLKEFILPGGSKAAAQAHVARSVCRRAERAVVMLSGADGHRDSPASDESLQLAQRYLNRLSDWLFILARSINQALGYEDVFWKKSPAAGDND